MRLLNWFQKAHAATYDSPAVYYTYAFTLPAGTEIHELASKLLEKDIAKSAMSVAHKKPHFGRRFKEFADKRQFASFVTTLEAVENGELTFMQWVRRNPKAFTSLLLNGKISFSNKKQGWRRFFDWNLAWSQSDEFKQTLNELREAIESIDRTMLDVGLMVGVQTAVDRALFKPGYLLSEPFVRLELSPIAIVSDAFHGDELMPLLLLHKSGVALLSFAAIPGVQTTEELLHASASRNVRFAQTVFSGLMGRLLSSDPERVESDEWVGDEDAKVRSIVWNGHGLPLEELFLGYDRTISGVAGGEGDYGDYMCYTTLFIDGLHCCGSKKIWLRRHSAELASLLARYPGYATIKSGYIREMLETEHGKHDDQSAFYGPGSTLMLRWDFGKLIERSSPVSHFHTLAIIEIALIQYWQLCAMEFRISVMEKSSQGLRRMQEYLLGGLDEYLTSKLVSKEAQEIEGKISEGLEFGRMYAGIVDRIGVVESLIGARAAEVAARKDILIAGIGAFAAVLLGLPAIKDILQVVSGVDTSKFPGVMARPLKPFASHGPGGVWALYLIFVAVVLGAVGLILVQRARIRHSVPRIKTPSVSWPSIGGYNLGKTRYSKGRPVGDSDEGEE
ncbi:hypothetical protein R8Z50_31145 [Longispora sp. K20-0274]|uniref:hypothetical protein n=1 Tax=Longispora sp. K20-0274 TaxID=3088255 RepID=UPI0039994950